MLNGLFSMDGPIYKFGTIVYDLFILNVLWFIFSIPIVTAGAATTALFYAAGKRVRNEDGYLFRDFWRSFKMNFKQSTIVWIIQLILFWVVATNIRNIHILGGMAPYMLPLQFVIAIELFIISIYVFPLIARFHITLPNIFKTAFLMANKHFVTTILCIAAAAGILFAVYYWGFFILFAMSAYAYWISYMIDRIFKKYIPKDVQEEKILGQE